MSSDPNVQVATHPSGHPNKTAVNELNPIFGRPADPNPETLDVSIGQAAIVQGAKTPGPTVVSPLINEDMESPVEYRNPTAPAEFSADAPATDWAHTEGAGLTDDTSSAGSGVEYRHHSGGSNSSAITPVVVVDLPTQEQTDAIVAEAAAEMEARKNPSTEDLDAVAEEQKAAEATSTEA